MFEIKVVEKIKIHILGSVPPPPSNKDFAFYEVMWKCLVEPDRPQVTV